MDCLLSESKLLVESLNKGVLSLVEGLSTGFLSRGAFYDSPKCSSLR